MNNKGKILVIDDEESIRNLLQDVLTYRGYRVELAASALDGIQLAQQGNHDTVILDIRMPDMDGLEALAKITASNPDLPVIMITAYSTSNTAIEAMKRGAFDYLSKPFDLDKVFLIMDKAINMRRLTREVNDLRQELQDKYQLGNIIGNSAPMQEVYKSIGKVAGSGATVLIQGESGTGKELVARAIHYNSNRTHNPFVQVNCAAIPEALLESELFGHERGAFTGAVAMRQGRFEQANGGSLFLDEIGEITPATQTKLLRVLQERRFERVGGNQTLEVDVRIIAATNRDLFRCVQENKFREDLYYRLNVFQINLPPLRERRNDIPLLVKFFLEKYGHNPEAISPAAMTWLQNNLWAGNVRELENTCERAIILAGNGAIMAEHLASGTFQSGAPIPSDPDHYLPEAVERIAAAAKYDYRLTLETVEKELILLALNRCHWNRTKAAELLNINRRLLYTKIQEYRINPPEIDNCVWEN